MMNPIRTWSQAVRSIIVGLELILLAAAMYLSLQPASLQPAAPVEPAQTFPITREYTYRVYSNQDGIYLQTERILSLGIIQLIQFKSSNCSVGVRLNDDITIGHRLSEFTPGNVVTFATSDLQISGDGERRATLQFDDWTLDFNRSCDWGSSDGG
jgi:hypothetical protein